MKKNALDQLLWTLRSDEHHARQLTPEESAFMDHASKKLTLSKILPKIPSLTINPPPLMADLQSVLSNMQGSESMAAVSKITDGSYADY
jgi:hypothetical protein